MERLQPTEGGGEYSNERDRTPPEPSTSQELGVQPNEMLTDEQLIYLNITEALRAGRPIDHATARAIAAGLHSGQASPLYALASSGAVVDGLEAELERDRGDVESTVEHEAWLDALDDYLVHREDRGPIDGWAELWPTSPTPVADDAAERAELMRLINAAGVTTLGEVATITAPEVHAEHDGPDRFSWSDAARWQPEAGETDQPVLHPELSDEELDTLFGEDADAEVGTADELGWFGIVRWPERPGGVILARDSLGRRHTWVVSSDAALDRRWLEIQQDYEVFYAQRDAYEQAIQEPEGSPSGLNPRVWVGSLADYNDGILHGAWFDATREPAELELATRYMLRTGENQAAEEWAAMDYDDFVGAQLGEHSSFEVVSRVACGIAEHGEAFGHWAAYVGSEDLDRLDAFEDHYRGEWESFETYIDDFLQETGFYGFMESVPEEMRGYVEVDVAAIARDWSGDYLVVELRDGRVAVIDATE